MSHALPVMDDSKAKPLADGFTMDPVCSRERNHE